MKQVQHFLNKLFNITHYEWPRVLYCFFLKTLIQTIYIIGSTLLVATFVEKFHIENLPFLYIFIALFMIIASFLFSFIIENFNKRNLMIALGFFGIMLIFLNFNFGESSYLFFFVLISLISFILSQINIILALFIEELFSPLESERTLPFIESSEPVGGIIGGMVLAFFAEEISITGFFIVMIWIFIVFMICVSFSVILNKIPKFLSQDEFDYKKNKKDRVVNGLKHIKGLGFLKGMTAIVSLQFILFTLIDFQYTSALSAGIESHGGSNDHSYASQLAHGLGFYHVMFSVLLFISQIFFSGRVNKKLGIMGAMKVHPLTMGIPGIFLFASFGTVSAVVTKGFFEVLSGIHRTAYHSSFYSLKLEIREYVKEFMEGIVRPIGMLIGTIFLIVVNMFAEGEVLHTIISGVILALIFIMFYSLNKMKGKYTDISKKNLYVKSSIDEKINAIEVLTQKGHENSANILNKLLEKNEIIEIKIKVLDSLGKIPTKESVYNILEALTEGDKNIQKGVLKALHQQNMGNDFFLDSFTKYRILSKLKELFKKTKSKEIKILIIKNFAKLKYPEITTFLIESLEKSDDDIVCNILYTLNYFDDINIAFYIKKYLKSENVKIKSAAIICLWKYARFKLNLTIAVSSMLFGQSIESKLLGIHTVGEIGMTAELPNLLKIIKKEDEGDDIKIHTSIALLKMNKLDGIDFIINFILDRDKKIGKKVKKMIETIPSQTLSHVNNILKHKVVMTIQDIMKKEKVSILENLSNNILNELLHLYFLIDEGNEIIKIKHILLKRDEKI